MPEGRATFYYDVNSPYAYLAAHRIGDLIPDAVWRPVALPMIFRARQKIPWSLSDERAAGQAECERRASERGLPLNWPDGWPAEIWSFNPLRAAVIAEEHDRLVPFTLECYRLLFEETRPFTEVENLRAAASAVGLDPDEVAARVNEQDVKDRLKTYTDEAIELGAVGVPTVAVGGELFWGDDRLEDAAQAAAA